MWLRARRETKLIHYEPDDYASSWCVDVMAPTDLAGPADGPNAYPVGRILADELRRFEIAEWGEDTWNVADADSSGLEAAWAAVLDEDGNFRDGEFEQPKALARPDLLIGPRKTCTIERHEVELAAEVSEAERAIRRTHAAGVIRGER